MGRGHAKPHQTLQLPRQFLYFAFLDNSYYQGMQKAG
jgi:hypothetical protein